MSQYGIWASRSTASVLGAAEAWLKRDGEPVTFGSYEEAAAEAERQMRDKGTPNLSYVAKEMAIEPKETPSPGMKLQG